MLYDEFVLKAKQVHKNKYEYKEFVKYNRSNFVDIICPIHGLYQQRARKHLEGSGCHKCAGNIKNNNEFFIKKASEVHNNLYNYNKVNYIGALKKVMVTCPTHGDFEQIASNHLRGFGCKKCYLENANVDQKYSNDEFIEKANKTHHDFYNYNKTKYFNSKADVTITCPVHGDFEQIAGNHLSGFGCKKCSETISSRHQELMNFLDGHNIKYIINDREVIKPYEIDIYIDNNKLGIEYHGVHWHSVKNNKYLHYKKFCLAIKNDIKLLQIFENEWLENKDLVKSMILNNLKLLKNRVYARNCVIKSIENKEYDNFCINNHIQGKRTTKIKLGLFLKNELIQIIGLNKHDKYEYEIMRICSKLNMSVVGGVSKLFKYFLNNYDPKMIMTYAESRYSNGDIYNKLGFKLINHTKPNYFYTKGVKIYSRQKFQKHKLEKKLDNFNWGLSEVKNMLNNGYNRLWDAGHLKFIWTKPGK